MLLNALYEMLSQLHGSDGRQPDVRLAPATTPVPAVGSSAPEAVLMAPCGRREPSINQTYEILHAADLFRGLGLERCASVLFNGIIYPHDEEQA